MGCIGSKAVIGQAGVKTLLATPAEKATGDAAVATKPDGQAPSGQPAVEAVNATNVPVASNNEPYGDVTAMPESSNAAIKSEPEETSTKPDYSTDESPGVFNIFIDALGKGIALTTADGTASLRVVDVEGGAIGLWNDRPHTEKVHAGDLVVKVRKTEDAWVADEEAWVADDATLMLSLLESTGPFEVQLKHAEPAPKELPSSISDSAVEAAAKAITEEAQIAIENANTGLPEVEDKVSGGYCGFWTCGM